MEQKNSKGRRKGAFIVILMGILICMAFIFMDTPLQDFFAPKTAPGIELVFVGSSDPAVNTGVYRYEVHAIVTGNPKPEVIFNRNDDVDNTTKNRTVILLKQGEDFNLLARASNSKGDASAALHLTAPSADGTTEPPTNKPPVVEGLTFSEQLFLTGGEYSVTARASDPDGDPLSYIWAVTGGAIVTENGNRVTWQAPSQAGGCSIRITVRDDRGGEAVFTSDISVTKLANPLPDVPVKPPLHLLKSVTLEPILAESGYADSNRGFGVSFTNPTCWIGDDTTNAFLRSFLSFNITDLSGVKVSSVELRLIEPEIYGFPTLFNGIWIGVVDYGNRKLETGDYYLPCTDLHKLMDFEINHKSSMGQSGSELAQELQYYIDQGKERFQLRLRFDLETSNNDSKRDGLIYRNAVFIVNYTK
jgi:hypothetical protein